MMRRWNLWACEHGASAVEFSLMLPILLMVLVGLSDFALAYYCKLRLESAVHAGADYATLTGTSVTVADVKEVIGKSTDLDSTYLSTSSTTYDNTKCYCYNSASSSGPTLVATLASGSSSCTTLCSAGDTSGKYVLVSATYAYPPITPGASAFLGTSLSISRSTWARVQ